MCTKHNIPYSEAKKIVKSRTPIIGTSYAAATLQYSNRKTYRTAETQTDLPTKNIPDLQKTTENINKTPKNLPQTQKSQSSSSKLPLHRRNKPNTTTTQTSKQPRKSASEKSLPSIKTNINRTNPSSKKIKELPTTNKKKKENIIQDESSILNLHPTDSSGNEDSMSTNSDEGNPDFYI